jgi:hypothetical protein
MVAFNAEQQMSNVEEFAWDEDPSMAIDFDEDEIFSYTGHDSFLSFCGNESESNVRWQSDLPHHTDIYDSMKRDDRRVDFTSKNTPACYKYSEDSFKPHAMSRQIPLVDMLGDIFSMRTMELQQQYESSKTDAQVMMDKKESNATVHITLDEQLAVAQKKLEESIRQSQMTRPKFIQFSESMMKNEACYNVLLSLKSNSS